MGSLQTVLGYIQLWRQISCYYRRQDDCCFIDDGGCGIVWNVYVVFGELVCGGGEEGGGLIWSKIEKQKLKHGFRLLPFWQTPCYAFVLLCLPINFFTTVRTNHPKFFKLTVALVASNYFLNY